MHVQVSGKGTCLVLNLYEHLLHNCLGESIWSFQVMPSSFLLYAASHHLDLLGSQGFTPADGFWTSVIRCQSRAQGLQSAAPVPADHR